MSEDDGLVVIHETCKTFMSPLKVESAARCLYKQCLDKVDDCKLLGLLCATFFLEVLDPKLYDTLAYTKEYMVRNGINDDIEKCRIQLILDSTVFLKLTGIDIMEVVQVV